MPTQSPLPLRRHLIVATAIAGTCAALAPHDAAAQTPPWSTDGAQQAGGAEPNPFGTASTSTPAASPATTALPTNAAANTHTTPAGVPSGLPQNAQPGIAPPTGDGGMSRIPGSPAQAAARNPARPQADTTGQQAPDPSKPLGIEQKAWDSPANHLGPGQTSPGNKPVHWHPGVITRLNLRQDMTTAINFPADTTITTPPVVSDPAAFGAAITNDGRTVTIWPLRVGIDGVIQISSDDGQVFLFYVRSHPWDYEYIADMYVPVSIGGGGDDGGYGTTGSSSTGYGGSADVDTPAVRRRPYTDAPAYDDDISARLSDRPRALATRPGVDYAAHANTGNGRIRTDLTIKIPDPASRVIAPVAAWRDDKFEFLDFGPRAASMLQWPVVNLVVDGVPSVVQTQVAGPNRSVIVVKAIGNLMLSNGGHIVCIKVPMVDNDPRTPALEESYHDRRGPDDHAVDIYDPQATPPYGTTPAGTGDYIDPRATTYSSSTAGTPATTAPTAATWPGQGPQAYHIVTGPYDMGVATLLADEIGAGYRGNPPAGAIAETTPASQVPPDHQGSVNGPVAQVRITARSPVLAAQLCNTLKQYNHLCTLY